MWKPRINPWNPSVVAGHAVACYKFKSAFVMNSKFFTITFLYLVRLKYFCMDKIVSKTFTSNSSVRIPFWFKYAYRNAEMNLKSTCWPGLIFNYILRTFLRISRRKTFHTFLIVKNTLDMTALLTHFLADKPCVIVRFAQRSTFSASFGSFESYRMVRSITANLFLRFELMW